MRASRCAETSIETGELWCSWIVGTRPWAEWKPATNWRMSRCDKCCLTSSTLTTLSTDHCSTLNVKEAKWKRTTVSSILLASLVINDLNLNSKLTGSSSNETRKILGLSQCRSFKSTYRKKREIFRIKYWAFHQKASSTRRKPSERK